MKTPNRGMILVVVMVAVVVIAALGAGYLLSARSQSVRAQFSEEAVQLLGIAEAGIAAAVQDLKNGGDGTLASSSFGGDGGTFATTTTEAGDYYTVVSTATYGQWSRSVEVVLEKTVNYASVGARAAIEADTDVTTGGNFVVDGRDYDYTDGSLDGDGVWGISSSGTVSVGGSSLVGGNGTAPEASSAQTEQNAYWGDNNDNDGDGSSDEELRDGVDNDGDGQTDEDTSSYPSSPDVRLGLPEGSLKAAAMAAGTYFTDGAGYEAYIASQGGADPGGKIYYIECTNWTSCGLGDAPSSPTKPSILVVHNSTNTASMKNLHGYFTGLLLPDNVDHTNGTALIYGAILCNQGQLGNDFGNGTATVLFSSNALSQLPSTAGDSYTKKSWREVPES